ncbi:MAG TPA: tetratricopeptide repeat protein [Acidimicrobiales bacterium]|nr:tetratricopeptide repeat protein [Acidimicrobiales bacterium]
MAPANGHSSGSAPSGASSPSHTTGTGSGTGTSSGTGSARTAGSRRSGSTRSRSTGRSHLGAGLVEVPPVPYRDPSTAVMADPEVAEDRRFCGHCGEPVGRGRGATPGRTEGFCRKCGHSYSFAPKLVAGDLVAGQYDVVGCLAHGGLGWIYLARDRNVSDRWVVLKCLLDSGDEDAMAAAVAERRFLAEVEHPNIVKIFNFVQHQGAGYIVMEYVGGTSLKDLLKQRRDAANGRPDPIPVAQAIAYMVEILPALGYLHKTGLIFCDFKPDNVIQTDDALKLIDMGGVRRVDDEVSPVYGTVGYQAPEIADSGPSVASDLFTVGRTLAVLTIDFKGYQSTYKYTLPEPKDAALFGRYDSLYRLLLRGTATNPDDRFQSADEMVDQLLGVLREVVAAEEGKPRPAVSNLFTGEFRGRSDAPDWRLLPALRVATDDPAAGFLATVTATDPHDLVDVLSTAPARTVEVDLRLARALIDDGDEAGADQVLRAIETADAWEWRPFWYRGLLALATGDPNSARTAFDVVYRNVPGELAPKLAIAIAAESANDTATAARLYDIVSRTDPAFTTAAFGLARCRLATGDRPGAVEAYNRVPEASSSYLEAQVCAARALVEANGSSAPEMTDLTTACTAVDHLALDGEQRASLTRDLFEAALTLVRTGRVHPNPAVTVLGEPLTERRLREGLERAYRTLAHLAPTPDERIRLVDLANHVRPRTLV